MIMKQHTLNHQLTHHPLLKAGYAAVAALMLQACQSTEGVSHSIEAVKPSALLFSDNQNTPAASAKTALVKAMQTHLASERYVLSTYQYRALPHVADDSIDAGSDSLWTTAIKTYEFKSNRDNAVYRSDAYRTSESYLAEDGSLPYLRYDDEVAGITPSHALPRELAMDEPYQAHKEAISSEFFKLRSCLSDASINLDNIIKDDPTATVNSRAIKAQLEQVDECVDDVNQALQKLQTDAQSYQIGDIASIRQCASTYRNDLRAVLASHRKDKTLSGEAYDGYDMAWQKFRSCNEPYVKYYFHFEPYEQILFGRTKKQLDTQLALLECIKTENQAYQRLAATGKTLANDRKSHLETYYQSTYCQANAVNELYPLDADINMPTSKSEADLLTMQIALAMYAEEEGGDPRMRIAKDWFEAYKQMKTLEQSGQSTEDTADHAESLPLPEGVGGIYANMLSSMLDHIKKTPEQLTAKNLYQYDNTVITILSHHQPAARQINSVLALDYRSATAEQSVQLPMQMNFLDSQITVDAAAAMPMLALATPKYAPSPDLKADLMRFGLPKSLQGMIPMSVVYDALTRAHLAGFRHMDAERFTPVALTEDVYARQIGAAQAIKFSPSTQDGGKLLGIMLKHLATDLKAYVDAHPEHYADTTETEADDAQNTSKSTKNKQITPAKIKAAIDDWVLINQGYQTDDVGSVLSLLQAIQPINSAHHFYYYLDNRGQLIGMQFVQSADQQMQNTRTEVAAQIRFSPKPIAHAYSDQLHQDFAAPNAIDGTAWLSQIREDLKLKSLAEAARESYQYDDDTSDAAKDADTDQ